MRLYGVYDEPHRTRYVRILSVLSHRLQSTGPFASVSERRARQRRVYMNRLMIGAFAPATLRPTLAPAPSSARTRTVLAIPHLLLLPVSTSRSFCHAPLQPGAGASAWE